MASLPATGIEYEVFYSSTDDSSVEVESGTEYEYDFVEKPSEDFYCPVTFDLLQEPHQMLCCGNHLSPVAVARLQGQPCPVCKEANLKTVPDKFFKRKVNELKVHCPNKSPGCEWVGELGNLDRHLSQNSVEGECQFVTVACPYSCGNSFQRCQLQGHKANDCPNRPCTCPFCGHEATYGTVTIDHWLVCTKYPVDCPLGCQWAGEQGDLDQHLNDGSEEGECQFVTVACPHDCGEDFQRCQLQEHKANDCPNRPFTCPYCCHEATYIKVTNEHWPLCKQYPLQCPNKCGENAIEQQHLPKHMEETCPLQVIKCGFSGCEVQCQRQHMQTHLEENLKVHLDKVSHTLHREIELLLARVSIDVQNPLTPAVVPPPDIVMTNFEKHKKAGDEWYSRTFYSHIEGYKMRLCAYANGCDDGEATHVSVFVHLVKGKYDDQLKWPFRGDVTIQLLNQSRDEGHWEMMVPFDDTAGDEYAGRVVGQARASSGWGYTKFISHTELNTENKDYLKYDCLKFHTYIKGCW